MQDNYSLKLLAASGLLARRVREAVQHLCPLEATSGESGVINTNWCGNGTDGVLSVEVRSENLELYLYSNTFMTAREGLEMLPAFEERAIRLFGMLLREDK